MRASLLAAALLGCCVGRGEGKAVKVQMRAKWGDTRLEHEAAEFLWDTAGPDAYWRFIDDITQADAGEKSPEDAYHAILAAADRLGLHGGSRSALALSLATRYYSPRIAAMQPLCPPTPGATVFLLHRDGAVLTDPEDISAFATTGTPPASPCQDAAQCPTAAPPQGNATWAALFREQPFDRTWGSAPATAILCASLQSEGLAGVLAALRAAGRGFVFRYLEVEAALEDSTADAGGDAGDSTLSVEGYGLSMMIKDMEYKAMDDKQKTDTDSDAKEAENSEEPDEVADPVVLGIRMDNVRAEYPSQAEGVDVLEGKLRELVSERESTAKINLDVWEVANIGSQTAYKILKNANPLQEMASVIQDFPRHASALTKISSPGVKRVGNAMQKALRSNKLYPSADGESVLYINGAKVGISDLSTIRVLEMINRESSASTTVASLLAFAQEGVASELTPKGQKLAQRVKGITEGAPAAPEPAPGGGGGGGGEAAASSAPAARFRFPLGKVAFMNDFEKDAAYASWPASLSVLLEAPKMYGAPSSPRKNVYTSINFIDPADKPQLTVAQFALSLYRQMAPIRMGVVLVNSDAAENPKRAELREKLACVFNHLYRKSPAQAFSVLYNIFARSEGAAPDLSASMLSEKELEKIFSDKKYGLAHARAELEEHTALARKKGILHKGGSHLFNGIYDEANPQSIVERFYAESAAVVTLLKTNAMSPAEKDVHEFLLSHHGAQEKRLSLVADAKGFTQSLVKAPEAALAALATATWITPPAHSNGDTPGYSFILVVDPTTETAEAHLRNIAEFFATAAEKDSAEETLKAASRFTVAVKGGAAGGPLAAKALSALATVAAKGAIERKRLPLFKSVLFDGAEGVPEGGAASGNAKLVEVLGRDCPGTSNCLVLNGHVTILDKGVRAEGAEELSSEDYPLLYAKVRGATSELTSELEGVSWGEAVEVKGEGEAAVALEDIATSSWIASKVFVASALQLARQGSRGPRRAIDSQAHHISNKTCPHPCRTGFRADYRVASPSAINLDVIAVLDPLSIEAQKVTSFLSSFVRQQGLTLHNKKGDAGKEDHPHGGKHRDTAVGLDISVYLNAKPSLSEVPLKTFYRYVMSSSLSFTEDGAVAPPSGTFTALPEKQVMTLGVHEPESWMVTTRRARYDLDNIKLADLQSANILHAEYELDSFILSGSCIDTSTGEPPRGLPLRLSSSSQQVDTLVMSNLGYFQLKANPGPYSLGLREDVGRALEVFSEDSISREVVIDSFNGVSLDLKVERNPGMAGAEFLQVGDDDESSDIIVEDESEGVAGDDTKKDGSVLSKLSGYFYGEDGEIVSAEEGGGAKGEDAAGQAVAVRERPTLNIFSVATGHLYERFLKIMIHTAMLHIDKNDPTKNRVKFWFLGNFLSPQFKQNIHKMAERWGFEVELVSYKWPLWLRRQTQKQRIIWGYKVLFLDVLFPLDVEKIIFVDADQIIRADLHELYNLDLEGAPVAYTPFCIKNKNDDTFGFRFWEQGYWKDHLQGRPYHISAIYVVDLKRFRAQGAGDAYRAIYDQLSRDPGSLANLDQDLPNYSQNMVKIFSLPEHWLWCETWCDQKSKKAAKTIDLCNNPLTKTPKLVNAKRIVPEWESYDKIIDDFEKELEGQ